MDDLAVIVVSTNEGQWLRPCLSSVVSHQGDCRLDLVVVDNESTDDTGPWLQRFLPLGSSRRETEASLTRTTAA